MGGVLAAEMGIWKTDLVGHCESGRHIEGSCSCLGRDIVVLLMVVVWKQVDCVVG